MGWKTFILMFFGIVMIVVSGIVSHSYMADKPHDLPMIMVWNYVPWWVNAAAGIGTVLFLAGVAVLREEK